MRSMWSGQLGFGMVQFPVKLFTATENHDVGFSTFHGKRARGRKPCLGPIKHVKTCDKCGEVAEEILRGQRLDDDRVITVSDAELDSLAAEQSKVIQVLDFVDQSEIDPISFEKTYYVGAAGPQNAKVIPPSKPYALIAEAMAQAGLYGVVKFTLRNKTKRAVLRSVVFPTPDGEKRVICLHTIYWPDEVRLPEVPGLGGDFTAAELKMANDVIESMVNKFDPDAEHMQDVANERLQELLDAKAEGSPFETAEPAQLDGDGYEDVSDLMEKLEASVRRHPAGKRKQPAKKAPARKPAPRRRSA